MSRIHTLLSSVSTPKQNSMVNTVASKPGFLSPEECNRILEQARSSERVAGSLGPDENLEADTRRSDVTYLMIDHGYDWLYNKIGNEIQQVNAQAYQYDLSGIEAIQLATYNEGDHYDWHMDLGEGDNSTRKLSMSIQISDGSDYEGGELDFFQMNVDAPRQQGSVIFFPSFLHHRVTPVTRGTRYSLVAWVHGDALR